MRSFAALSLILAALLSRCARCSSVSSRHAVDAAAPPAPPVLPHLLDAPRPWTFNRQRVDPGLALPEGCRYRALTARASVDPTTRFVAVRGAYGTLVVADADGHSPHLTGIAAVTLDPNGTTRAPVPLPWFEPHVMPHLTAAGPRWIASLDQPGPAGAAQIALWRDGQLEVLGEGDHFETMDLLCEGSACALLTSRPAKVAVPGAVVWMGSPESPVSRWTSIEIVPEEANARPRNISWIEPDGSVRVTLEDRDNLMFYRVTTAGVLDHGKIAAPHGVLDVAGMSVPLVMTFPSPVNDDGCAVEGPPGIRFAREGQPPVDIPMPAPPTRGVVRRLAHGAVAVWLTPLGCKQARQVLYGLLVAEGGVPVGKPIPIGDASSFAVSVQGDNVDMFLQDGPSVFWVQATCDAH